MENGFSYPYDRDYYFRFNLLELQVDTKSSNLIYEKANPENKIPSKDQAVLERLINVRKLVPDGVETSGKVNVNFWELMVDPNVDVEYTTGLHQDFAAFIMSTTLYKTPSTCIKTSIEQNDGTLFTAYGQQTVFIAPPSGTQIAQAHIGHSPRESDNGDKNGDRKRCRLTLQLHVLSEDD